MTWFSLENLLITIFCIILAIFIARYAENRSHQIWALFNCAVAIWALGAFLASISKTPHQALVYWKLAYSASSFIPALLYHFICAYYDKYKKMGLILFYGEAILFLTIILFTNQFINSVQWVFNCFYYNQPTIYFNIWWTLWNMIVIYSFYEFRTYLILSTSNRIPSLIIFWSMLIGFIGGASTSLLVYGIKIYPSFHISICLYALMIAYGIFYHRILPINVLVRRSIIYSLLAATISLIYLSCVIFSQHFFNEYLGYSSTIVGSMLIAIAFIPLKNKFQQFIDRSFFKASPIEIAHQNEQLREEISRSEKFKIIATLASGLAHEIKNPLTTLNTFAEYVPQKKDDPEFMEQYKKIIPQEIERIDNLVHDLLYFAKPSAPQIQKICPDKIIGNIILMLKNKFESLKINVSLQLDTQSEIQADPNQLKQTLLNLILNAIDAMPNGGTLTISTKCTSSRVIASEAKQSFIIEISDTGCGIDPKDIPHIFEPFFTKKDKGTGLGLAITQGIVEKHGGKIEAQSKLGIGTKFTITFPIKLI